MSEILKVGIVGAGTMGRRIAFACVARERQTRLFDVSAEASREALEAVRALLAQRLPPGAVDAALARLSVSPSLADCVSDVDLAIETVPESVALKRQVFAEIGRHADARTLVGTNTSSIPGSWLADASGRPENVFNFNWGHADDLKVELMGHPGTAPATLDSAETFIRTLGLVPIRLQREIVGYASNRVWRAVKKEVLFLIDQGYLTPGDVDRAWMLDWGTLVGPCGLMDRIGLDVVRDIEMVYYEASGDPADRPPQLLLELIAQGKLGVKTGEGFYHYPDPVYQRAGWLKGKA